MSAAPLVDFDPTRDRTYEQARSARAVADWLAWLELEGLAPRTLDQYERDLSRLCLTFPSKEIHEVTDGDMAHVLRTFPERSRRVRKASFDSFFKWAVRHRRIDLNPMDLLPRIKRKPQRVLNVFSDAEVESLLSIELADRVLLRILLDAGLRKAEARHLRVRDCQLERRQIVVLRGKGDRDRIVPMTLSLQQELAEFVLLEAPAPTDHLWYGTLANASGRTIRRSKPIGDATFHRWWGDCLKRAGVPYRKPHTARHTCATNWRRRGLALDEVQMILGHESIQTTSDLYVHTNVFDLAGHMALIEAVQSERG